MKSFTKTYPTTAPVNILFAALTNPAFIADWSGSPATMSATEGADFSLWDGSIIGRNLTVTPTLVVQDWKENSWDACSRVAGRLGNGEITLSHSGIPDASFADIVSGWDNYYLLPSRSMAVCNSCPNRRRYRQSFHPECRNATA